MTHSRNELSDDLRHTILVFGRRIIALEIAIAKLSVLCRADKTKIDDPIFHILPNMKAADAIYIKELFKGEYFKLISTDKS